jgi:hypothetical protein
MLASDTFRTLDLLTELLAKSLPGDHEEIEYQKSVINICLGMVESALQSPTAKRARLY